MCYRIKINELDELATRIIVVQHTENESVPKHSLHTIVCTTSRPSKVHQHEVSYDDIEGVADEISICINTDVFKPHF